MKLGTDTGSLVNHLYSTMVNTPAPEVGMGCTVLCWTDRHACTVVEVDPAGKFFVARRDKAQRIDKNGMSECQEYLYMPDPHGITYLYKRVKSGKYKGQWREGGVKDGSGILLGERREYHDFSF